MTAEPAPDGATPRWGMPDAAVCFVAGFFTANLAVAIAAATGAEVDSLALTAAGLVGLWIGLAGSMLVVSRMKGSGSLAVDFGLRSPVWRDLVGVPVGVAVQVVVNVVIYGPLTRFISDLSDKVDAPAQKLADQAGHGTGLVVLGLLVVVGAPVFEELFYRGLLLRSVNRRFGPNVAIAASAIVFAGAHFELIQFPALLVLGVLLGVLAVRYNRLGLCICVHAGFNLLAMVSLVVTHYSA